MNLPIVELKSMTKKVVDIVVLAIMSCRNGGNFTEIEEYIDTKMSIGEKISLIHRVIKMGHFSVIEHINFVFTIENISRSCSHQLVRHRLASFSQESQRTVDISNVVPIVPYTIEESWHYTQMFKEAFAMCKETYNYLIENGISKEHARLIMPNATPTKMVMSFNAHEMYHIFDMRLCLCAEDEILRVVDKMKYLVQNACPELFPEDLVGPTCLSQNRCFQDNKKCRRYQEIIKTGKATR